MFVAENSCERFKSFQSITKLTLSWDRFAKCAFKDHKLNLDFKINFVYMWEKIYWVIYHPSQWSWKTADFWFHFPLWAVSFKTRSVWGFGALRQLPQSHSSICPVLSDRQYGLSSIKGPPLISPAYCFPLCQAQTIHHLLPYTISGMCILNVRESDKLSFL